MFTQLIVARPEECRLSSPENSAQPEAVASVPVAKSSRSAYVIFHAGEVYARDCVRWYSPRYVGESERFFREYHNIGDSVVYDSTLKVLGFDNVIPVDFNNPDPGTVELIKATCSHGILRGSNYFHPEMQWGNLVEFVRRMGLPLVVFGIGVQARLGQESYMGSQSELVARALGDHCVSLGVRGERSAQMFADVGVKNVRIVGCPSMFRSLKSTWELRQWKSDQLPPIPTRAVRTSVTLRREIGPDYVANVPAYLAAQRKFIFDADAATTMTLFAQGELYEKYLFCGRDDLLARELQEAMDQGWLLGGGDPMVKLYSDRLFFSDDVEIFCDILSQSNFVTGFRVHGVLPGLSMGRRGVLVNYDSRTDELIKTFDIPSIPIEGCSFGAAYDVARNFNYDRVSKRYAAVLNEGMSYFYENGIPHRMKSAIATLRSECI